MENCDLIILGAGPAGLSASIYAGRYKINHLVIGKLIGGSATEAFKVENWPGTPDITGIELSEKMQQHAQKMGGNLETAEVTKISKNNGGFEIDTQSKKYQTKTLILALGTQRRKLNIPGEQEFLGKGVAYCATCDGPLYKNKVVGVVGGGNAAATSALMLAQHAKKVFIFVKDKVLNAEPAWQEQLTKNEKITILFETNILEIQGDTKLTAVKVDKAIYSKDMINLDGLFIEIGAVPAVDLCKEIGVEMDKQGYIKIGRDGATNITGVFAAGDITDGSNKFAQILTASAEGTIAAYSVFQYMKK